MARASALKKQIDLDAQREAIEQLRLTPSSHIQVRIEGFEGAFEELYDRVRKGLIGLYDFNLYEVTLQVVPSLNLDEPDRARFEPCVRIAHLLLMKSRSLLPVEDAAFQDDEEALQSETEAEDAEELERIKRKLFGFEAFRAAGLALREKEEVMRGRILIGDVRQLELPWAEEESPLEDVGPLDLFLCFSQALERLKGEGPMRISLNEGDSLEERISTIVRRLGEAENGTMLFSRMIAEYLDRAQMALTFLAVIYLLAREKILARQDRPFEDIAISLKI